jgi:hypothetical protein
MNAAEEGNRKHLVPGGTTNDMASVVPDAPEHTPSDDIEAFTSGAFDALFGLTEATDEDTEPASEAGRTDPGTEPLAQSDTSHVVSVALLDDSHPAHRQVESGEPAEVESESTRARTRSGPPARSLGKSGSRSRDARPGPNLPAVPTQRKAGRKPPAPSETVMAGASVEFDAPVQVNAHRSVTAEPRTGSCSEVRECAPRVEPTAKAPEEKARSAKGLNVPPKKTNRTRKSTETDDDPAPSAGLATAQTAPRAGVSREALALRALLNEKDRELLALRNELNEIRRTVLGLKESVFAVERDKVILTEKLTEAEAEARRVRRERDAAMADVKQARERSEEHKRSVDMMTTTVDALRRDHEQLVAAHNARVRELTAEHEQTLRSALAEAESRFVRQQATAEAGIALAAAQAEEKVTRARERHEQALANQRQRVEQLQRELEQALANLAASETRQVAAQQSVEYAKDALAAARAALDRC